MKPLQDSKSRLARVLPADRRAELTGAFLKRALAVLKQVSGIAAIMVVSSDSAVLEIARRRNVIALDEEDAKGLNPAVTRAARLAAAKMAPAVLILPADLPFIRVEDVEMMIGAIGSNVVARMGNGRHQKQPAMVICTDTRNDGTNALLISPPTGFTFQYGAGSFQRHLQEAARLGLSPHIVHAHALEFDLDTEEDWHNYQLTINN